MAREGAAPSAFHVGQLTLFPAIGAAIDWNGSGRRLMGNLHLPAQLVTLKDSQNLQFPHVLVIVGFLGLKGFNRVTEAHAVVSSPDSCNEFNYFVSAEEILLRLCHATHFHVPFEHAQAIDYSGFLAFIQTYDAVSH
jgi:hypothetical protein